MDTTEKKAVCVLTAVKKRYTASVPVLGPVSLTLHEGEILGIRGCNGAGKSTLLGVMAGVLRPDTGSCVHAPEAAGRIGYAPQELSLYTSLTGLQNLRFWGMACGMRSRALSARSRWLLERLELSEQGKKAVSAYSGGMKRRLQLASALMGAPRLLLLDEPTAGADDRSAKLMFSLLKNQRRQGCGIALTSHRAGELETVCDRIVTLEDGLITAETIANERGIPAAEEERL